MAFWKHLVKPKLLIVFLILVLGPLAIVAWLGVRLAGYEQRALREQFVNVLQGQLGQIEGQVADFLDGRRRELLNLTETTALDDTSLRELGRRHGMIRQAFRLDAEGRIIYPAPEAQLNVNEWSFLNRARDVLADGSLRAGRTADKTIDPSLLPASSMNMAPPPRSRWPGQTSADNDLRQQQKMPAQQAEQSISYRTETENYEMSDYSQQGQTLRQPAAGEDSSGWTVWYWGKGAHLMFWRERAGEIIGVELDRARLLADIIAVLPDTPCEQNGQPGRIILADMQGQTLYQWGRYEPAEQETPLAVRDLRYPLGAWQLRYYLPAAAVAGPGQKALWVNLLGGAGAMTLALLGLAIYFYREHMRAMRQAAQRVTFVNQVSHELKTPLTNIRMYAELLQQRLEDDANDAQKHSSIIVSESRRLSRLIGNILSFGRRQRGKLQLHYSRGVIDEVIRDVMENFRVALTELGIAPQLDLHAQAQVLFDRDAVEQILGNLINNVEKYAASGGSVRIASCQEGNTTIITVADRGPGIPPRQREKIFAPFYRLSNKLTDGVSGTGIGLSIARDLARLHGGDIKLLPAKIGAAFEVRLQTPAAPVSEGDV